MLAAEQEEEEEERARARAQQALKDTDTARTNEQVPSRSLTYADVC
jgi:hypothetical protein